MVIHEFEAFRGAGEPLEIPNLSEEVIARLDSVALPPLRESTPDCVYVEVASSTYGVGKTRAVRALEQVLTGGPVVVHRERWEENHYLGQPDMVYHCETCFLRMKAEDVVTVPTYPSETVLFQDVPPELDWLYAATDWALGRISDAKFDQYQDLYGALAEHMVRPDLVVYLECGLEETLKRVEGRARREGRGFELSQAVRIVALAHLTERWM